LFIYGAPAVDSPAEKIGLREGDQILAVDNQEISSRRELIVAIVANKPGDTVSVQYLRDGQSQIEQVVLAANPANPQVAFLGVASDSYRYVRQNVFNSVGGLFVVLNPKNIFSNVVADEPDMMTRPTTVVGASQVGGEIGRSDGLKGVLILLASVNIFVGVFNLVPLLPFDGGHAAIATYERLRSRRGKVYRADVGKMIPVATTVVVLLVMLMFAGLYLDITSPLG
jgi:membrane-associated protease RseP (regulator of RpoE activity)